MSEGKGRDYPFSIDADGDIQNAHGDKMAEVFVSDFAHVAVEAVNGWEALEALVEREKLHCNEANREIALFKSQSATLETDKALALKMVAQCGEEIRLLKSQNAALVDALKALSRDCDIDGWPKDAKSLVQARAALAKSAEVGGGK